MFPEYIILGTTQAFLELNNSFSKLPFSKELDSFEIVASMFAYIGSMDDAYGNVLEFANDLRDSFEDDQPPKILFNFFNAIVLFGDKLIEQIKALGIYQEGLLWYTFDSFLSMDIIVKRIPREDFDN